MKKILVIAYDINPELGSESSKAYLHVKALSQKYEIIVFTNKKHESVLKKNPIKNTRFVYIRMEGTLYELFIKYRLYNFSYNSFMNRAKKNIAEIIKTEKICVIHCLTPSGIWAYNDLYKFKLPMIIGPLGGGLREPKGFNSKLNLYKIKYSIRNLFYDLLKLNVSWTKYFHESKLILIGTDNLKKMIPEKDLEKTEIFFDTTVDDNYFKRIKSIKRSPIPRILFSGRLEPNKGCELLFFAYEKITKENPGLKMQLCFAGSGSLEKKMREYTTKNKTRNVYFLGRIDKKQLLIEYNKANIFCFPTLREPGGPSILEAMACELPVITTDYGGPSISVTDKCGIKIKPKNSEKFTQDLVQALKFLIVNKKKRDKLGKNGRKRIASKFSINMSGRKLLGHYLRVLNG